MFLVRNAIYLAWNDVKARYRKSMLGPMWQTLGNLIAVVGFSVVWANLLEQDLKHFVPSLTIGLIIWQLVAGAIAEGADTFTKEAQIIRNVVMPLWFFVVRALSRQSINFAHNTILIAGVLLYYGTGISMNGLFGSFIGVVLAIANLSWIMFVLGVMGARFRDIEYAINSVLPILFFVSPVLFRPDRLSINQEVIWMNPLSYFIEAVRAPLLTQNFSWMPHMVLLVILMIGAALSWYVYKTMGRRLAFWV